MEHLFQATGSQNIFQTILLDTTKLRGSLLLHRNISHDS